MLNRLQRGNCEKLGGHSLQTLRALDWTKSALKSPGIGLAISFQAIFQDQCATSSPNTKQPIRSTQKPICPPNPPSTLYHPSCSSISSATCPSGFSTPYAASPRADCTISPVRSPSQQLSGTWKKKSSLMAPTFWRAE